MVKNTQTSIKLILWSTIVVAIIIGAAFVAGTFYPNYITLDKLEDEIHKQELKVVESLGTSSTVERLYNRLSTQLMAN